MNPGGSLQPLICIYIFNSYNWSEAYDFGFILKVGVPSLGHMPLTIGVCTTEVGCVIIELTWSFSGESGELRGLGNRSIPVLEVK